MKVTHLQLLKALFVPGTTGGKTFERTITPQRYAGIEMKLFEGGVFVKYQGLHFYIPAGSYECALVEEEVLNVKASVKKA